MDTILKGADRTLRFDATDEEAKAIEGATVVITVYNVQTGQDIAKPPVTATGNTYKAIYRNTTTGTFRAIAEATDAGHVGVEVDEWRVTDPRQTP